MCSLSVESSSKTRYCLVGHSASSTKNLIISFSFHLIPLHCNKYILPLDPCLTKNRCSCVFVSHTSANLTAMFASLIVYREI